MAFSLANNIGQSGMSLNCPTERSMPYTSSQSAYPEAVRCSLFGGRLACISRPYSTTNTDAGKGEA